MLQALSGGLLESYRDNSAPFPSLGTGVRVPFITRRVWSWSSGAGCQLSRAVALQDAKEGVAPSPGPPPKPPGRYDGAYDSTVFNFIYLFSIRISCMNVTHGVLRDIKPSQALATCVHSLPHLPWANPQPEGTTTKPRHPAGQRLHPSAAQPYRVKGMSPQVLLSP